MESSLLVACSTLKPTVALECCIEIIAIVLVRYYFLSHVILSRLTETMILGCYVL